MSLVPIQRQAKTVFEEAAVKCVTDSFPEVSLHEMRDAPDADLLHHGGFHVGLEVVRAIEQRDLDAKSRLTKAVRAIQDELERCEVRGQFRVRFDLAGMHDLTRAQNRAWSREVPRKLAMLLARQCHSDIDEVQLQQQGISHIVSFRCRPASGTSVGYGWRWSTSDEGTLAAIALASKDRKLRHYRQNNGDHFRQYWLAIASLGPGTIADGGFSMLLDRSYSTDYDRVFLLFHGPNGRLVEARDVTPDGRCKRS